MKFYKLLTTLFKYFASGYGYVMLILFLASAQTVLQQLKEVHQETLIGVRGDDISEGNFNLFLDKQDFVYYEPKTLNAIVVPDCVYQLDSIQRQLNEEGRSQSEVESSIQQIIVNSDCLKQKTTVTENAKSPVIPNSTVSANSSSSSSSSSSTDSSSSSSDSSGENSTADSGDPPNSGDSPPPGETLPPGDNPPPNNPLSDPGSDAVADATGGDSNPGGPETADADSEDGESGGDGGVTSPGSFGPILPPNDEAETAVVTGTPPAISCSPTTGQFTLNPDIDCTSDISAATIYCCYTTSGSCDPTLTNNVSGTSSINFALGSDDGNYYLSCYGDNDGGLSDPVTYYFDVDINFITIAMDVDKRRMQTNQVTALSVESPNFAVSSPPSFEYWDITTTTDISSQSCADIEATYTPLTTYGLTNTTTQDPSGFASTTYQASVESSSLVYGTNYIMTIIKNTDTGLYGCPYTTVTLEDFLVNVHFSDSKSAELLSGGATTTPGTEDIIGGFTSFGHFSSESSSSGSSKMGSATELHTGFHAIIN